MSDPQRTRTVQVELGGATRIAVVFENTGGRLAKDYRASIAFLTERDRPPIQITDVLTEGLDVMDVYSARPDLLTPRLRGLAADANIVAAYRDYLSHAPRWGDGVFLKGTLASGMYELVSLAIVVPAEVTGFLVVFTLDCSDGWWRAETRVQGCLVKPTPSDVV
jgi:hypothetical protein